MYLFYIAIFQMYFFSRIKDRDFLLGLLPVILWIEGAVTKKWEEQFAPWIQNMDLRVLCPTYGASSVTTQKERRHVERIP